MSVIALENVQKVYDGALGVNALDDINLKIEHRQIVAIMGPSGSGKTTLMNLIGLLDRPSSGRLFLGDEEVSLTMSDSKLAQLRSKKVGFVFQSFNLLSHFNAFENVLLPSIYTNTKGSRAKLRAHELLAQVGLEDRMHHRPSELSGGEKQRVAIARALINDPEIILADEPTGNLDSKTGKEIVHLLQELNRNGRTIVIITHDQAIADECERTIRLLDGRIVHDSFTSPSHGQESWWGKIYNYFSDFMETIAQ